MYFGITTEALLEEMENIGTDDKPKYAPKYKLSDLLDDDYRVIRKTETVDVVSELKHVHGLIVD